MKLAEWARIPTCGRLWLWSELKSWAFYALFSPVSDLLFEYLPASYALAFQCLNFDLHIAYSNARTVHKIKLEGVAKSGAAGRCGLKEAERRLIGKWLWRVFFFFFADQAISCLYPTSLNFQRDVTAISRRSCWRRREVEEERGCLGFFFSLEMLNA